MGVGGGTKTEISYLTPTGGVTFKTFFFTSHIWEGENI